MIKILLKKQLTEIFRSYYYDAKKNKARSKLATAAYIGLFVLLMAGVLGGIFTFLSLAICTPFSAVGMDWLYFAIMGLIAVLLGVFGSVFNTYAGLYLAKDNDFLLSMPIPVNAIMISRLLGVYLMGLMYSGIVLIPAVIVYWIVVSAKLSAIISGIIFVALVSLFVLTLSAALGYVVAKISLKLKNKSFITVIISLVFFGAYYFVYFKAQSIISHLISNAAVYGEKIKGAAYPIYIFGNAATGDLTAMLIIAAVVIALFLIMWRIISSSFIKISTATGVTVKKKYKATTVKQKGTDSALLRKEFNRFTSSPSYMLNCGFGILFLFIGGIAVLIKGREMVEILNAVFSQKPGCTVIIISALLCMLASMNDIAAPSVSLEGKSLWLLQSLPVRPWQALKAKLRLQLILTVVPLIFAFICTVIVCKYTALDLVLVLLISLSYALLSSLFGLFLAVKMPNLNWTNEITPIKQSASVGITLLVNIVYPIIYGAVFFIVGYKAGYAAYMAAFSGFTLALSAVLYLWLKKKGSAAFAAL
ncbi:MAG: hypothetical protein U0K18_03415 [Acutalibacteraceae bacterium]|nr:hypothetical protein [Acutalibacteraceae bacterium]